MHESFGKTQSWRRILLPAIVLIGLFSLPATAWFLFLLLERFSTENLVIIVIMISFVVYFPVRHICDLYTFPMVEIDHGVMVVTEPFQGRQVYALKKITKVKAFLKSVFFLHNGFPVVINLHGLQEEERKDIVTIMVAAISGTELHHANRGGSTK
ncbi:MAG TPA: hypothetical protein ENJ32_13050 [Crenotrichaceae bacterium]|nr:hypothetical protein [Crenotrichaceae bacterium]